MILVTHLVHKKKDSVPIILFSDRGIHITIIDNFINMAPTTLAKDESDHRLTGTLISELVQQHPANLLVYVKFLFYTIVLTIVCGVVSVLFGLVNSRLGAFMAVLGSLCSGFVAIKWTCETYAKDLQQYV